jgi:hypothetical protein
VRVRHQPVDLGLGLHDRAHVVMEREPDAALAKVTGDSVELRAEAGPCASESTGRRDNGADGIAVGAAVAFGEHHDLAAHGRKQIEMRATAATSSAPSARHKWALYHPDTRSRPCVAMIGRNVAASRGNLPPSSMPA